VQYLLLGLGLGLGAGLAPGPLLALVVTTTLSRGFGAGVRVACAPLVTDIVVIAASALVVHSLPDRAAGVLGVVGGLYVLWLGVDALRVPAEAGDPDAAVNTGDPLRRGALVNLLSPHPWLFWFTVGAPVLVAAYADSPGSAVAFLAGFYLLLVGVKVATAALVATGRRRLSPAGLRRSRLLAAVLLLLTGALLVVEFARPLITG
jgi:threonine/homoserine/homoserine lactone efflux protein